MATLAPRHQQGRALGNAQICASVRGFSGVARAPVGCRHVLNEGSHLLRRHTCAAGFHLKFHAVCQGHAAPDLHHAGFGRPRRRIFGRAGLQLPHAVQAQPCIRPATDQKQLLQMPVLLPRATLGAVRAVHQTLRDVEAHRARGYAGQGGQIVNGVPLWRRSTMRH